MFMLLQFITVCRLKTLQRCTRRIWNSSQDCRDVVKCSGIVQMIENLLKGIKNEYVAENYKKISRILVSCYILRSNQLAREFYEYTFMSLELIKKEENLTTHFQNFWTGFTFFQLKKLLAEYELWRSEDLLFLYKSINWYEGFVGTWKKVDEKRDFSQIQTFIEAQAASQIGLAGHVYEIANKCFWSTIEEQWKTFGNTDAICITLQRIQHDMNLLGPHTDEWTERVNTGIDIVYFKQLTDNNAWDNHAVNQWEDNLRELLHQLDSETEVLISYTTLSPIKRCIKSIEYTKDRCENLLRTKYIVNSCFTN